MKYLSKVLRIIVLLKGFTYLRFQIFWGKRIVYWFKPSLNKIDRLIKRWTNIHISLARGLVFTHSILNVMGNYIMSCYKIPKKIIIDINLKQAKFWWGKTNTKLFGFFMRVMSMFQRTMMELVFKI